jgi:hypothetical protein
MGTHAEAPYFNRTTPPPPYHSLFPDYDNHPPALYSPSAGVESYRQVWYSRTSLFMKHSAMIAISTCLVASIFFIGISIGRTYAEYSVCHALASLEIQHAKRMWSYSSSQQPTQTILLFRPEKETWTPTADGKKDSQPMEDYQSQPEVVVKSMSELGKDRIIGVIEQQGLDRPYAKHNIHDSPFCVDIDSEENHLVHDSGDNYAKSIDIPHEFDIMESCYEANDEVKGMAREKPTICTV